MDRQRLLKQLDKQWVAFKESYAGLTGAQLTAPGAAGDWSVKDILAHVTTWEEEALKALPHILQGGRPPRYSVTLRRHRCLQCKDDRPETRPYPLSEVLRAAGGDPPPAHRLRAKRPRRTVHSGNPLPPPLAARHLQPLPGARPDDPGMAGDDQPGKRPHWRE